LAPQDRQRAFNTFTSSDEREIGRDTKENRRELVNAQNTTDCYHSYTLSDGNEITTLDKSVSMAMSKGLPRRSKKEIVQVGPGRMKTWVFAPPELKYAVWRGGSVFAPLITFPQMVITYEEYNSTGPGIVHRRCWTF
jgi:hypothetical protein